jgi:hypothetical protein
MINLCQLQHDLYSWVIKLVGQRLLNLVRYTVDIGVVLNDQPVLAALCWCCGLFISNVCGILEHEKTWSMCLLQSILLPFSYVWIKLNPDDVLGNVHMVP